MKSKQWKHKDFVDLLKRNGYRFERNGKGDHRIYTNGSNTISVPYKKQHPKLITRLIRQNNLTLAKS